MRLELLVVPLIAVGVPAAVAHASEAKAPPTGLAALKVPGPGFSVRFFSKEVPGARSMALGGDGTVYVGTRQDRVYAVRDDDGDGVADRVHVLATGLNMPNGVAVRGDDLYVAEVGRVLVWRDIAGRLARPGPPEVVTDAFPEDRSHGWKFIAFGPDGKLYVPVGAPCNICDPDKEIYASITRMNPDGSGLEVFAHGIRNSVGFDWHPKTGDLWFSDNGRDHLGDTVPPCEINRATAAGQHFGYPYCHAGTISDPEFGEAAECARFRPPAHRLEAHAAPLGLRFYSGKMLPERYRGSILLAEHGSWNRSSKVGYRVMNARLNPEGEVVDYQPFLTGFLDAASQASWGRPVDVQPLPDGSILISDDQSGSIYRVTYADPS